MRLANYNQLKKLLTDQLRTQMMQSSLNGKMTQKITEFRSFKLKVVYFTKIKARLLVT